MNRLWKHAGMLFFINYEQSGFYEQIMETAYKSLAILN